MATNDRVLASSGLMMLSYSTGEKASCSTLDSGCDNDEVEEGAPAVALEAGDDPSICTRGGSVDAPSLIADGLFVLVLTFGDVGRDAGGDGPADAGAVVGRPLTVVAAPSADLLGRVTPPPFELGFDATEETSSEFRLAVAVAVAAVRLGGAGAVLNGGEGRETVEVTATGASSRGLIAAKLLNQQRIL